MRRCIVIADDDPTIISLVKLRLGMARYNVLSANDAGAALKMVHANQPVAVILMCRCRAAADRCRAVCRRWKRSRPIRACRICR
jgi:DNA-binding response OmpR family regulator